MSTSRRSERDSPPASGRGGASRRADAASGGVGRRLSRLGDPDADLQDATVSDRSTVVPPSPPSPGSRSGATQPSLPARHASRPRLRRRANVRRLDPWSVLKLSVVFYLAVLGLFMAVLTALWTLVNQLGIYESALGFLIDLNLEVQIQTGNIARALFLVGLLGVVLFSALNVFFCFLYNLVADLSGGLQVTLEVDE